MSLYDIFFPHAALANEFRSLRRQKLVSSAHGNRRTRKLESRLEELEQDVGYLTVILGAVVERLHDKGIVERRDLGEILAEVDAIDGVADGKLDVNYLRGRLAE